MQILIHANGYTLDAADTRFDAVVWDGGRIVAVGSESELRLQFGRSVTDVIDVAGATVVPGFIDSHLHVAAFGEQTVTLDLTGVTSAPDLLQRVEAFARTLPQDAWVLGAGWDDNRFLQPGFPTLEELDAAAGGRPALLTRVCRHAYLANRSALRRAGLSEDQADPPDGHYGRDIHGLLNGLIYENASVPLLHAIPPMTRSNWKQAVRAGLEQALAQGITAVHTDDVRNIGSFDAVWDVYHQLIDGEGVRMRVHELVDWSAIGECLRVLADGPGEDEWLTRGAAKLFSDGAMGSRTAWLSEPYSDQPESFGTPIYTREALFHRVRVAHEAGFGAAIHAIGDAAVDLALAAMAEAPPVNQRDRLIHAEVIRPDLVERMQHLGEQLAVDVQPRFTVSDFPWIADRVGPRRVDQTCAWKTLADAGIHIAGGSDCPIEPCAPLLGMHAAVARRLPDDRGPGYLMQQALSPREAVALFTRDAAFASGSEGEKGIIAPGYFADFTVLSEDIVEADGPDVLLSTQVLATIVGGQTMYNALGVPDVRSE